MLIGGWQKLSLLDYPDHLSTVIFTIGCNFRCHFCYNPQLVVPGGENKKGHSLISEDDLFQFLQSRMNKLEAVVITGGEPTLQKDLIKFIKKIKQLKFLIKLDTNGTNPEMLEKLISLKLVDYIAMDIKAPLAKYQQVVNAKILLNDIKKSIKIIIENGVPYEFRTTIVPDLHSEEDIMIMGQLINGADKWYLQSFHGQVNLVNPDFKNKKSYSDREMKEFCNIAKGYVKHCGVR